MSEHTPGPWQVNDRNGGGHEDPLPFWIGNDDQAAFVADVLAAPDADLIAAAPDLLEALSLARSMILSGERMTPQAEAAIDGALTKAGALSLSNNPKEQRA